MGALLLLLSQSCLPDYLSRLLPLLYIAYRIAKMVRDTLRLHIDSYTTLQPGRWTAVLPESKHSPKVNSGSDGVVMMVLGARINQ